MRIFRLKNTNRVFYFVGMLIWMTGFSAPAILAQNVSAQNDNNADLLQLSAVNTGKASDLKNGYDPQGLFPESNVYQKQAFNAVSRQALPLSPDQILKLKKMLAVSQHASAASGIVPPKPTLSTQEVSLAPGALPPVIRLQEGFVTSVVFVDSTGANWPIESYDLGNNRAFNIQWQRNSNVLMIQAMSLYNYGNLAVKLAGMSTPVMLTLVPGQEVVDYRVDLHVQQSGPNAKPVYTEHHATTESNNELLNVLDGVSPKSGKPLRVIGGDAQAWLVGEKLYLRTRLDVISPGWLSIMTSPDGMKVYLMGNTPTILVSQNGKPVALKLEEE